MKRFFIISLSLANATAMLWLTFFMLAIPQVLPDEYALVQWTSIGKNLVLKLEKKPDSSSILFVNVAWDKVLIDKPDPDIPELIIGSEPITDRNKLIALLKILHKKPHHRMIVFDIFFKGKSEHDSTLTALLNTLPNCLVSFHRDERDKPDYPDLKLNSKTMTLSDLEKSWGMAMKFKIFHNNEFKSTPLQMYERLYKKKFSKGSWFFYIDDQPVLNSFILDYRVRRFDYTNSRYPHFNLGEWVDPAYKVVPIRDIPTNYNLDSIDHTYTEKFIHNFTKNRLIFVGDFEDRDIHETIYGATPGPLVLLDAFLAIEAGDNKIHFSFLALLFTAYFFVSYLVFGFRQIYPHWIERLIYKTNTHRETFFETFTILAIYMAVLSIFSFFTYSVHIGVLVLAFYLNILEKIKQYILKVVEKRALKAKLKAANN